MALTIAHLSDVHLAPVVGLGLGHLNIKRGLGLANWMLKRRKVHLRAVVDKLTADLAAQKPDHIIVSGDLVNLGLPGEHAAALEWLRSVGPPSRVTVVPGNHDIYCPLWRDRGVERWREYMASDAAGKRFEEPVERGFPFVRILDKVAVVGLVSAVPTAPGQAIGRMGGRQIAAAGRVLERLGEEGFARLVVIHHPPLPGQASKERGLVDAADMEEMLQRVGADLVVHGHNHRDMQATRQGPSGPVHVLGIASASIGKRYKEEPLGRYNLLTFEAGRGGIEVVSRGLAEIDGPVAELRRQRLETRSLPLQSQPLN